MADYTITWVDLARQAHESLPPLRREILNQRIASLAAAPQDSSGYDSATDQWSTTYGAGTGLILFALSVPRRRVTILRILDLS